MKICILYDGDYPWEVRIQKMTATLAANGYEVHVVCRNLTKQAAYEASSQIHIHRLPCFTNDSINQWCSFPAFFNPMWIRQLGRVIKKYSIGLLIVRDLPLSVAAIMMGRTYNLPVILDMAENYPAMLRDLWKYEERKCANLFLRNPIAASAIEWLVLKSVTHIIVVTEESQNRLIRLGVAKSSVSIVRNTPVLGFRDGERHSANSQPDASNSGECFNLIYVGGLEPVRGLSALIQTMAKLIEQFPGLRLTIVGGGKWQTRLQAEVARVGVSRYVTLTGRLPYSEALKRVGLSDAGIIPHLVTAHTMSTVPNKLFEYMAHGIPVLATNMAPVRRLIEDTGCGYVYSNLGELATALKSLSDHNRRKEMGNNGLEAIRRRYNWEIDGAMLLNTIRLAMPRLPPQDVIAN